MDINKAQKKVIENKINKGFNTTNINLEFNLLYGEVAEAFDAYLKKTDNLPSELADVAIYLMGIAELLGISLEDEIIKKMEINENRIYKVIDGKWIKIENDHKE